MPSSAWLPCERAVAHDGSTPFVLVALVEALPSRGWTCLARDRSTCHPNIAIALFEVAHTLGRAHSCHNLLGGAPRVMRGADEMMESMPARETIALERFNRT